MKSTSLIAVAALVSATAFTAANADPISVSLPGNTQFDGWESANLSGTSNPGYGGYPGALAWPGPIGSLAAGSGDAGFMKSSGNAYPGGGYIYSGGSSNTVNLFGAAFNVSDSTPVANLANVVFQVDLTGYSGFDFHNNAMPVLNYNGGSQALPADLAGIAAQEQISSFGNIVDLNTYLVQWDLSAIAGITSFEVTFADVQHAQIFALQLDQSDSYEPLNIRFVGEVPEPSTVLLAAMGVAALGAVRLARRKQA